MRNHPRQAGPSSPRDLVVSSQRAHTALAFLAAALALGCGGTAASSGSTQSTATSNRGAAPSHARASDDEVLSEALDGCMAAMDREGAQAAQVGRGVCHCVVARGREDPGFLAQLRARDEAAMTAQVQQCLRPSMAIPFGVYALCVEAATATHEECADFVVCVQQRLRSDRTAEEFDAWFPAQGPEAQRQMATQASAGCAQHLQGGATEP